VEMNGAGRTSTLSSPLRGYAERNVTIGVVTLSFVWWDRSHRESA